MRFAEFLPLWAESKINGQITDSKWLILLRYDTVCIYKVLPDVYVYVGLDADAVAVYDKPSWFLTFWF